MNEALQIIHDRLMTIVKEQPPICGAWYFGSASRAMADEYSDLDVVFLVDSAGFEAVAARMTAWLEVCCDRVVLCYPEGYNGQAIVNNGYLLELDGKLVVYDVFLLNSERLDEGLCRMHYATLRENSIIFDRDGRVRALISDAASTPWQDDAARLIDIYWYHAHLSAKYLLRGDFFKLEAVMRTLMDAHISLLLTFCDRTTWGGSANKLHFLPADKQQHLKKYGCSDDFPLMRANLLQCFQWFEADVKALMPAETAAAAEPVLAYWLEQTRSLNHA